MILAAEGGYQSFKLGGAEWFWLVFSAITALLALAVGVTLMKGVLAADQGTPKMREIAKAIQEGALAYLRRQFRTIVVIVVPLAVLVFLTSTRVVKDGGGEALSFAQSGIFRTLAFIAGCTMSGLTGFIGMSLAVRGNVRTAAAARSGSLPAALKIAFRTGGVAGMFTVGLGLLGATAIIMVFQNTATAILVGFGFGGSLLALFMRVGGGIFTKAADVGADLVGKIEAGIPEDDPRNPAVIADNVGDNVGDCAGMAADLFETYAVTAVAVMLLGVLLFDQSTNVALYPLVLGAISIVASLIGTFAVRSRSGNVERALYQGMVVSAVLAALAFIPATYWMMRNLTLKSGGPAPHWWKFYLCALIGLGITGLLFVITDYYTSTRFGPVKRTARASQTGHATNIIQGLASGMQATAAPAIVIALGILGSWKLAGGDGNGIYGIGVAVMAQLSLMGLIVALDAFGPITDNAGGIAEMADLPEDVRNVTDPLDAVGNTTKAVTKGYAIGSAALAALVLFDAFQRELSGHHVLASFELGNPPVLIGLLVGGMMVYLFASLSMEAVGRAGGAVVEEVRRQFREKPGIMEGTDEPEYGTAVALVTRAAQREMILPALIPIVITLIVGLISVEALGGLLIGVIVVGLFLAIAMTAGGGAWDNAKKLIEDGAFGGKGSEAHAAAVTGDTVGDPYKDTAGPAINPMIKVANIVAILIIPIIT
jgi:K(+)-stimulated pyrophosphate-energized sodium pump